MKTFLASIFCAFSLFCNGQNNTIKYSYPLPPAGEYRDTFWGIEIKDTFHALEKDNIDRDTWIEQEEEITKNYFKKIHSLNDLLHEPIGASSMTIPWRSGPYYLSFFNGAVYYSDYLRDRARLLYSADMLKVTTTYFSKAEMSDDGKYCALMYSNDGSDWHEISIFNLNTSFLIKDHIRNVKHSNICWFQNGFYYTRYDSVIESKRNSVVEKNQRVYYHYIGTDPFKDSLMLDDPANPYNTFIVSITKDKRFVIITEDFPDENKTTTFFKDTRKGGNFKTLVSERNAKTQIIGTNDDTLIALTTNGGSSNGKIVEIDTKHTSSWGVIMDNQQKYKVKEALVVHDTIVAIFQQGFFEYIAAISGQGDIIYTRQLAIGSSYHIICYSPDQNSIILSKSYDVCPDIGELFSMKDFSIKPIYKTNVSYNPFNYQFYITNYASKDGTLIPIYILTLKDNLKKGPLPLMLTVDGSFGHTPEPHFNSGILTFLNNGGIYAIANIRGGSNSGKNWRDLGCGLNKQNAIDDIYFATKFLIDSGFAQSGKIAIASAAYAAPVVAAVINQHPDLFKVALFLNGLFDLLHYERFTSGKQFTREYGSVTDDLLFETILSYDPIYNIKPHTTYPSIFITASELNTWIPPLHSYKYAAALQQVTGSKNPILMYMSEGIGYVSAKSFTRQQNIAKYYYDFLFKELGMNYKYINYMKGQY